MSLDERMAELRERLSQARTNRGIARNVALDNARFIERTIVDLRRKLEHDPGDTLTEGGTIPYMGLFGTSVVELEKNLTRIVHFDSDHRVAKYDLEELQKEVALATVAGLPTGLGRVLTIAGREPAFQDPSAAAHHLFIPPDKDQPGFNENNCAQCGFKPEWHPIGGTVPGAAKAEARDPWISHGFMPTMGAHQFCAAMVEGPENEATICGQHERAHKQLAEEYSRCGLPKEAHSIHPSPVNEIDSPHGHEFIPPMAGDSKEAWQNCQFVVMNNPSTRPDPRSHRFQGGNGAYCTYSIQGMMECGGARRDHELL